MRRCRVPYLQRREASYYFRFQLPPLCRSLTGRHEIRQTLNTSDSSTARERVARVLPLVYSLKRACRRCMELTADEARRAISYAINQLLEALQAFDAPWLSPQGQDPEWAEIALFQQALNYQTNPQQSKLMQAWTAGTDR